MCKIHCCYSKHFWIQFTTTSIWGNYTGTCVLVPLFFYLLIEDFSSSIILWVLQFPSTHIEILQKISIHRHERSISWVALALDTSNCKSRFMHICSINRPERFTDFQTGLIRDWEHNYIHVYCLRRVLGLRYPSVSLYEQ